MQTLGEHKGAMKGPQAHAGRKKPSKMKHMHIMAASTTWHLGSLLNINLLVPIIGIYGNPKYSMRV